MDKKTTPEYCDMCGEDGKLEYLQGESDFDRDGCEYVFDVWVCPKCQQEYIADIRYVQ